MRQILFILLVLSIIPALRLFGVIDWPWLWALSPYWLALAFMLLFPIGCIALLVSMTINDITAGITRDTLEHRRVRRERREARRAQRVERAALRLQQLRQEQSPDDRT